MRGEIAAEVSRTPARRAAASGVVDGERAHILYDIVDEAAVDRGIEQSAVNQP
jgi:hypothetical protein